MDDDGYEILEEWEQDFPMKLVPQCDHCGGDATGGQSMEGGVICLDCLRKAAGGT